MQKNGYNIYLVVMLFLYNCSSNISNQPLLDQENKNKIKDNKLKVSIEQQKNKIIELEELVKELNSRIEYQENMLNTISSEFRDQIEIINRYDSSNSDITMTLIKMKNKFEVLEDRAFYSDSVYFEIINDLVKVDSKIEKLSDEYKDVNQSNKNEIFKITDQEYSRRYYQALNSFINNGVIENSLIEFKNLINDNSSNTLADNCQYWIGEIYYKQKLFKESIAEFEKVFTFSNSNKIDDAQYKIILCYMNMNDAFNAIEEINKLKNNYIDSEYFEKANLLLNKLKQ